MINFMRWRYGYFILSLLFLVPGVISLLVWRVQPSIDFTGGSLLEIQVTQRTPSKPLTQSALQSLLGANYHIATVQQSGLNQVILRGAPISDAQKNQVLTVLRGNFAQVQEQR